MTNYVLSRKNGSFPGGKRTLRFFTYDEMRVFLRRYIRQVTGSQWQRSVHPPMWLIVNYLNLVIKKESV